MSIHPNDYNLKQVLSESGDLYVPWFQRDYTWGDENIDDLFLDLFDEYSWESVVDSAKGQSQLRDYFMGAVMLCGPGSARRMILDGQQRLTTLTMLLAYLLKRMRPHKELQSLYQEGVAALKNASGENRLKLKEGSTEAPRECDDTVYRQIIDSIKDDDGLPLERDTNDPVNVTLADRQIFDTYVYLAGKVDEQIELSKAFKYSDQLALRRLYEILTTRLIFVSVRTDDEDYAIKFFETLNARGEELRPDDLVKNALFLQAGTDKKVQDLVIRRWNSFAQNLRDSKDRIDFLRFEWNSKHGFIGKSRIYRNYKQHFLSLTEPGDKQVREFGDTLVFQSDFYSYAARSAAGLDFCRGLNLLGAKICRPAMLAANNKFKLEVPAVRRERIRELVRILESVMIRCSICERVTTALEKGFAEIARYIHTSQNTWPVILADIRIKLADNAYRVPSDDEFRTRLENAVLNSSDLVKYKWRVFFATLERHVTMPGLITIPSISDINLSYIGQGNSQYIKSVGNIRITLDNGEGFGAKTINPSLAEMVPSSWGKVAVEHQKERVIEAALDCWKI